MKRKKITRAYKEGRTDASNGKYSNPYTPGSVQYREYDRGFTEGATA